MTWRRMLALSIISSFLLLGVGVATAPAATRKLCAKRANLYDSPNGVVVGRLFRPQRVTIVRRSANRRWVHVRARTGLRGWIIAGALCRG